MCSSDLLWKDAHVKGLARCVRFMRAQGSVVGIQLAHAGRKASMPPPWKEEKALSKAEGGWSPVMAPSAIPFGPVSAETCALSAEQIQDVVSQFAEAATRALAAGFQVAEIHAAHGYLLSEFLSPFYNRRSDEYGGSPVCRARIVMEVLQAVKTETGSDFPVLLKINAADFAPGGMTVAESLITVKMLQSAGLDAVEISGGIPDGWEGMDPVRKGDLTPEREVFYREEVRLFKEALTIPVILVGGIRSWPTVIRLLDENLADYLAFSRPLIAEPGLINRWESGDTARAECVSCNQCFRPMMTGRGLYCVVKARARRKNEAIL